MATSDTPWRDDTSAPQFPTLTESIDTDVAIIGGGITGVTLAYLLAKEGVDVTLLECEELGNWGTGATTAFITSSIDTDTRDLIKTMGIEDAKRILSSHEEAIDTIESIAQEEGIECEFSRAPNIFYANAPSDMGYVRSEHEANMAAGQECTLSETAFDGFTNAGYLHMPEQATFHPLKYLYALAQKAKERGARIYTHTKVEEVEKGEPFVLTTPNGIVRATRVVAATHIPFKQPIEIFFLKAKYKTYMLEVHLPKGVIAEGIYEDTDNPYHYFRIDPRDDHDRMILGGEDHRDDLKVSEEKSFASLEEYLARLLPGVAYTITRRWTGIVVEPIDGLAYIGALHDNFYYATAYSGTGMTYGTLAAQILTDQIQGRENPYQKFYDIDRVLRPGLTAQKAIDYVEELFGGAVSNTLRKEP